MLLNFMAHRFNAIIIAADRQAPKPAGAIVVQLQCPVPVWKFQATSLVKIAAIMRCVGKRVATGDGDIANGRLSQHVFASLVAKGALMRIFALDYAAACPRTDFLVVLVVGGDVLPECRAGQIFTKVSICSYEMACMHTIPVPFRMVAVQVGWSNTLACPSHLQPSTGEIDT